MTDEPMSAAEFALQRGMNYLQQIPASDGEVPTGHVLVHNHVRPASPLGMHGFRAWTQPASDRVVECACGWAPDIDRHFRVVSGFLAEASDHD